MKRLAACVMLAVAGAVNLASAATVVVPDRDWEYVRLDETHIQIYRENQSHDTAAIPIEAEGDLEIPREIKGLIVSSIGPKAFYGCSKLTSVVIPEGVTNVADAAFQNCTSLTNIVIPVSMRTLGREVFSMGCANLRSAEIRSVQLTIGDRAFYGIPALRQVRFSPGDSLVLGNAVFANCPKLSSLTVDMKSVSFGKESFSACSGLAELRVSSKDLKVDASAFAGCGGLSAVALSSEDLVLGDLAFSGCVGLPSVTLSSENLALGSSSFSGCTSLRGVTLSAEKLVLGASSFLGCNQLCSLTITAKALEIGSSAFSGCNNLTNAVMRGEVSASIGDSAFKSCARLAEIELPESLRSVSRETFKGCSGLTDVSFSTNLMTIAYSAFEGCSSLKTVSMSEGLRTVEPYAFYDCKSLESLSFPQSLESLGTNAFQNCSSLVRVDFPQNISTNAYAAASVRMEVGAFYKCWNLTHVALSPRQTVIPAKAFAQCESLVDIMVSSNLVSIADNAFESCSALPSFDFPSSLVSIGLSAFFDCSSLTDFTIPTNKAVSLGALAFKNTKYWRDWPNDTLVENSTYILGFKGNPTSVELPAGCVEISDRMFEGMTSLKSVTLPPSVMKIGSRAFAGSGLESISLGNVKSIAVSAFEGCSNLVSIVSLSPDLKEIPASAFKSCVALESIDIPSGVTKIGENAFQSCTSLKKVTGCEGVFAVGDFAFAGDGKLQSFRIPNDVVYGLHVFQGVRWTENVLFPLVGILQDEYPESYTQIVSIVFSSGMTGIVARACSGCRSLETFEVPSGVKSIGPEAFADCVSLSSVVLPSSLTSIGSNAFVRCKAIKSVVVPGVVPVAELFPELYKTLSDVRIAPGTTSLAAEFLSGCAAVKHIDIPVSVTSIGDRAFAGCEGLGSSIDIPEGVASIGSEVFWGCSQLKSVLYFGDQPSVGSNLYRKTSSNLVSAVLRSRASSWADGGVLPSKWPENDLYKRSLAWLESSRLATVYCCIWPSCSDNVTRQYIADGKHFIYEEDLPEPPEREGWETTGVWYTAAVGGTPVEFPLAVTKSMTLYLHWVKDGEIDPDDPEADMPEAEYDFSKAHVFYGAVKSGDVVVGSFELKVAKGKVNRKEDTVTAKVTATVNMLGEGKLTFKGEMDGECCGVLVSSRRGDEREISFDLDMSGPIVCLVGDFDGYELVGSQNFFAGETPAARLILKQVRSRLAESYALAFVVSGTETIEGGSAFGLTVKTDTKGKVKVSGVLADGKKLSTQGQMFWTPEGMVCPVVAPMYNKKLGGLAFSIDFLSDADLVVSGCSPWIIAGKEIGSVDLGSVMASPVTPLAEESVVSCNALDLWEDQPEIVLGGKKWRFPKNPASLNLSWTSSTGLFKGSFKVPIETESGRVKKVAATVNGAVVNGVGYGHALIRGVGTIPLMIGD